MLGFLIALAGGAATPYVEGPLARPLAQAIKDVVVLEEGELRLLAFMITMVLAGLLCALFGTGTPAGLAIGGTLGYFGLRLLRWLQRIIEARRD